MLAAVPPLLLRVATLSIEDLLEHLAHSRTHQGVLLGVGVMIASADPGQLAGVQIVVILLIEEVVGAVVHGRIVAPRGPVVNGRAMPRNATFAS
jgi:hypothetical protein